jgi:hypothetical protein
MRQLLSPSEYMLYHALCQGGYPATLTELMERLRNKPYERELTVVYTAALASRLEGKGYVKSEKVQSGKRGQPPTSLTPVVPLSVVIRAEAERAVEQLGWDDREALCIIGEVVEEALARAPKPRRKALPTKRPAKVARARIDGRSKPL